MTIQRPPVPVGPYFDAFVLNYAWLGASSPPFPRIDYESWLEGLLPTTAHVGIAVPLHTSFLAARLLLFDCRHFSRSSNWPVFGNFALQSSSANAAVLKAKKQRNATQRI